MRGRIRTRSLASSSPNEKRAPGALFGNATLYVETPAGGIKPVSGAPDVDHTPARGLIGDVAAHASAVGRGYAPTALDPRLIRNAVAEDPARGVGGVAPTYEVRGVWVAGRRGRR